MVAGILFGTEPKSELEPSARNCVLAEYSAPPVSQQSAAECCVAGAPAPAPSPFRALRRSLEEEGHASLDIWPVVWGNNVSNALPCRTDGWNEQTMTVRRRNKGAPLRLQFIWRLRVCVPRYGGLQRAAEIEWLVLVRGLHMRKSKIAL